MTISMYDVLKIYSYAGECDFCKTFKTEKLEGYL